MLNNLVSPHSLLFFLSTMFFAITPVVAEDYDLYLLIGQSNMAGRAELEFEDEGKIPRTYLFDRSGEGYAGKWIPATNPLNAYSTIRGGLDWQKLNPGSTFAKTITQLNPAVTLGLVVNAKGGTVIGQWVKGTAFYSDALGSIRPAMATGGTLKGILWLQGESDMSRNTMPPDEYLDKLAGLIADFRNDLNMPDLPWVASQIYDKPLFKAFNTKILELPDRVPNTAVILSGGLTENGDGKKVHFDAQSQRILGQRFAEKINAMVYGNTSL